MQQPAAALVVAAAPEAAVALGLPLPCTNIIDILNTSR